jgi:hypothetical protein
MKWRLDAKSLYSMLFENTVAIDGGATKNRGELARTVILRQIQPARFSLPMPMAGLSAVFSSVVESCAAPEQYVGA